MKIHQSLLAVCTLALLMSVPVVAGDMPGPGSSQPIAPPPAEGSKASSKAIISSAVPGTAFYELMQVVLTVL